ncbi:MAG: hypothetical protein HZY76_13765 [Anaerolineae bacterium]|nr:MAG: hypothetical protein HZY76_13765 [Anaerolineae bacterium]
MAQQRLHEDLAEWDGGGLQPDLSPLLEVLAGDARPVAEQRLLLDLTIWLTCFVTQTCNHFTSRLE